MKISHLKIKKTALQYAIIGVICISCFCSCAPSEKEILKKYEGYQKMNPVQNKLGIQIYEEAIESYAIFYFTFLNTSDHLTKSSNYSEVEHNMKNILQDRFIVLNANNLEELVEYRVFSTMIDKQGKFSKNFNAIDLKVILGQREESLPPFILLGFKGIREEESEKWATPAIFYLLKKEKDNWKLLTPDPLLSDNLFPIESPTAQFIESKPIIPVIKKQYVQRIALGGGKTLALSFSVATIGDVRIIESCEIGEETKTDNYNGTYRFQEEKHYGYNIKVGNNGSFSTKISDFRVSGTLIENHIKGSIKNGERSYNYSINGK